MDSSNLLNRLAMAHAPGQEAGWRQAGQSALYISTQPSTEDCGNGPGFSHQKDRNSFNTQDIYSLNPFS